MLRSLAIWVGSSTNSRAGKMEEKKMCARVQTTVRKRFGSKRGLSFICLLGIGNRSVCVTFAFSFSRAAFSRAVYARVH